MKLTIVRPIYIIKRLNYYNIMLLHSIIIQEQPKFQQNQSIDDYQQKKAETTCPPVNQGDFNFFTWRASSTLQWSTWCPDEFNDEPAASFDFKRVNYTLLAQYLSNIDRLELFTCVAPNYVEVQWHVFKAVLMDAIYLNVPQRLRHTHTRSARHYPFYIRRAI